MQLSLSFEKCVLEISGLGRRQVGLSSYQFSEGVCSVQVLLEPGAMTLSQELEAGRGSLSCLYWVIFLPIACSYRAARHPWARVLLFSTGLFIWLTQ